MGLVWAMRRRLLCSRGVSCLLPRSCPNGFRSFLVFILAESEVLAAIGARMEVLRQTSTRCGGHPWPRLGLQLGAARPAAVLVRDHPHATCLCDRIRSMAQHHVHRLQRRITKFVSPPWIPQIQLA